MDFQKILNSKIYRSFFLKIPLNYRFFPKINKCPLFPHSLSRFFLRRLAHRLRLRNALGAAARRCSHCPSFGFTHFRRQFLTDFFSCLFSDSDFRDDAFFFFFWDSGAPSQKRRRKCEMRRENIWFQCSSEVFTWNIVHVIFLLLYFLWVFLIFIFVTRPNFREFQIFKKLWSWKKFFSDFSNFLELSKFVNIPFLETLHFFDFYKIEKNNFFLDF